VRFLTDENLFVYVIMALYCGAIVRYAFAANWPKSAYWFFALGLTCVVTFFGGSK
jgi:hypothetical protein